MGNEGGIYHAKLSLDGVSCAACTSTISTLLQNSIKGINTTTVQVSLLPFPTAEFDYDSSIVTPLVIAERVEEIGFGAELIDNSKKGDTSNNNNGIRMRTVRVDIEYNLIKAIEYFSNHEAVDFVEDITTSKTKKSKISMNNNDGSSNSNNNNANNNGGILSIRYRDDMCGIRTLIEGLQSSSETTHEEEEKKEDNAKIAVTL